MEVALIGGGIGGLTAALYLHKMGIACRVYESAPEFKALGVGINLFSHAIRKLTELGLGEPLARVGLEPERFYFFDHHGKLIYDELTGRKAGYRWPHLSFHRADLHQVLLDAVRARLGTDAILTAHRCTGVNQDDGGVIIRFEDSRTGQPLPPARADVAIGCDGIHSAVRRQFYPNEGPPAFGGINMWRGITRGRPFLGGNGVVRAGALRRGKLVAYPIKNYPDGTQLLNWVVEVQGEIRTLNDWSKPGRLEDFIGHMQDWHFDWLDVPDLLTHAELILEYPMVDRDPIPRWTFGRVTLLGDAAHPMYPRGGNGAAQSIIDAETLADALATAETPQQALERYQASRLEKTARVVTTNRTQPPDFVIETVDQLTDGRPFDRIEDVIARDRLVEITEHYKRVTGLDVATVNR